MSRRNKYPDIANRGRQQEAPTEEEMRQIQLYHQLMAPQFQTLNQEENYQRFMSQKQRPKPIQTTNVPQTNQSPLQDSPLQQTILKEQHIEQPFASQNIQTPPKSEAPKLAAALGVSTVLKEEDFAMDIEKDENLSSNLREFGF